MKSCRCVQEGTFSVIFVNRGQWIWKLKAAFLDLWRDDKVNKAERVEKREKRKDHLRNYK